MPDNTSLPKSCSTTHEKEYLHLAGKFNLPLPLATILYNRGFKAEEKIENFLYPDFSHLPKPDQMFGMADAVACIVEACEQPKKITIHGDYDVDGVTATALLVKFFQGIGLETNYYIPNRLTDHYGFTTNSVDNIQAQAGEEPTLVVTVDCGITAHDTVEYAREKGMEVIITDHHEPGNILPDAAAVINPKQKQCNFPFKELSGVGVAFFFVAGIRRALIEKGFWKNTAAIPNLKQYLDLVALGTIADVMPLEGTNRILVRAGLEVLNRKRRLGVFTLAEQCGMYQADIIQAEDVSFKLAPRINAAGRMGQTEYAIKLLLTDKMTVAKNSANKLEKLNSTRKELERGVLEEIFSECETLKKEGAFALTIFHKSCHPGILGIIASRIVDKFDCPAIVVTIEHPDDSDNCILKGSGRSIEGINIYEKLGLCSKHLEQFGGHPMAIGVTLHQEAFSAFRAAFDHCCAEKNALISAHQAHVDYQLNPDDLTSDTLLAKLQLFQPFGEANPEPLFTLKQVRLKNVKDVSGHLKFSLATATNNSVNGIGFYLAEKIPIAKEGPVDIIFKLKRSSYRGVQRKEIQLVDLCKPNQSTI